MQLTSAPDPAASYSFTYDRLGRATSIDHDLAGLAANVVMAQAFDAAGNRTQLAGRIGTGDDFVTDYAYDESYSYDENGSDRSVDLPFLPENLKRHDFLPGQFHCEALQACSKKPGSDSQRRPESTEPQGPPNP